MSERWWRAYESAIDHPKLLLLPSDRHRWGWFCLMSIASAYGGALPDIKVVAVKLRTTPAKAHALIADIIRAGLFDDDGNGNVTPHNWARRQFKSDVSTERVKRFRQRPRNVSSAVSETPPETETETETEKKEDAASAAPSRYAFESGVIRVNQRDFDRWKSSFSHLDVPAELESLAAWAQSQRSWFSAVAGALGKRNREMQLKLERERSPDLLTADQKFYGVDGIPGVI